MLHSQPSSDYVQVFVGLDVHKETIRLAALHERHFVFERTVKTTNLDVLRKTLVKLRNKYGVLKACYEASGAGYGLQRQLGEWGFSCEVIAPSLMPTRPGDRRKTDEYDARKLAEFFANGQLTSIRIPTEEEEAVSDLVRCRFATKKTQIKAKHRLVKFLAKKGKSCAAAAWTNDYLAWLSALSLDAVADNLTLTYYREHLEHVSKQLECIDASILAVSKEEPYSERVSLLRGFYAVDTLTAMVLVSQLGDIQRFRTPRQVMSYVGLTPSMNMSGGSKNRAGSITKTGNSHSRHVLVQAAWNYLKPVRETKSKALLEKQRDLPSWAVEIADTARERVRRKMWKIAERRGNRIAIPAGARELAGFLAAALMRLADVKRDLEEASSKVSGIVDRTVGCPAIRLHSQE